MYVQISLVTIQKRAFDSIILLGKKEKEFRTGMVICCYSNIGSLCFRSYPLGDVPLWLSE